MGIIIHPVVPIILILAYFFSSFRCNNQNPGRQLLVTSSEMTASTRTAGMLWRHPFGPSWCVKEHINGHFSTASSTVSVWQMHFQSAAATITDSLQPYGAFMWCRIFLLPKQLAVLKEDIQIQSKFSDEIYTSW